MCEVNLAILNIPPAGLVLRKSGVSLGNGSAIEIVPVSAALSQSVHREIYLTIYNAPCSKLIISNTCVFKCNTSIFDIPPAGLILRKSGVGEINHSLLHIPPAGFILCKSGICGVTRSVNIVIPFSVIALSETCLCRHIFKYRYLKDELIIKNAYGLISLLCLTSLIGWCRKILHVLMPVSSVI